MSFLSYINLVLLIRCDIHLVLLIRSDEKNCRAKQSLRCKNVPPSTCKVEMEISQRAVENLIPHAIEVGFGTLIGIQAGGRGLL